MPLHLDEHVIRKTHDLRMIRVINTKTKNEEEVSAGNVWPPNARRPQLFIVEKYTLRSFKGDLARDQIIGSFSLTPHAKLTYNIFSKAVTDTSSRLSTTVMESQSKAASTAFNQSLKSAAESRFGKNNYDYQMDASFHAEADITVTGGDADADAHAKGSTQEVRSELAKSTQSAIDAQVSATDELRTQRTSTDDVVMNTATVTETRMVKEIVNSSDAPVNIGVFQLKEETITLLCLTDVLIGFKNTVQSEDKLVSVRDVDTLLKAVIESPDDQKVIKNRLKAVLEGITDYQGVSRSFIKVDPGTPDSFQVDTGIETTYDLKKPDGTLRRSLKVKGIVIKDYVVYLRKPNTTVELPINAI